MCADVAINLRSPVWIEVRGYPRLHDRLVRFLGGRSLHDHGRGGLRRDMCYRRRAQVCLHQHRRNRVLHHSRRLSRSQRSGDARNLGLKR